MSATDQRIRTDVWERDADLGVEMWSEVERSDVDEVALYTFEDGEGSQVSLYWTCEAAREMAYQLLKAARPR
jgi:uncharacterized protein YaeQ